MARYRDFDAWREHREPEPLAFTMFGEEFRTKARIPMWVILDAVPRLEEVGSKNASDMRPGKEMELLKLIGQMMEQVIGGESWSRLLALGIDFQAAMELMTWILSEAMGAAGQGGAEEAGEAGKAGSRSGSPSETTADSGEQSRQTSGGFTMSPPLSLVG